MNSADKVPAFNVYELEDPKEEDNQPTSKKKTKTKTLIPDLVHHIHLKSTNEILYLVKVDKKLVALESIEIDGQLYKPKQDLPFICLNSKILKLRPEDPSMLLERTIQFIREHVELPYEQLYLIVALYVGHTYFVEHFDVTPILNVFGVKETGKTRLGEVLSTTAYRAERCTSPTESTLFRAAQAFRSTLIIDEIKLWGRDGNKPVADLIKSRYKRGMKVPRINLNRNGEDQIEYFDVFAPLVICSTESMPEIIESRCITIVMQQNINREVEKDLNNDEAEWIRNQWTLQRLKWMDEPIPDIESASRRRLKEITQPLLRVCNIIDPKRLNELRDYIDFVGLLRAAEEGETLEAEIVRAIHQHVMLTNQTNFRTKDITGGLNRGRSEKEHYSVKYVSACLSRLGFEKIRMHGGQRGFQYNDELVKKLLKKYRLEELEQEEGVSDPEEDGVLFIDEKKPLF